MHHCFGSYKIEKNNTYRDSEKNADPSNFKYVHKSRAFYKKINIDCV